MVALETPSKPTLVALQFAFAFVFLGVGGVLFLLFGALSFYFHGKDFLAPKQHLPFERAVLVRFMQRPVPGDANESRILKLQNDYEQMVQFRQSTLLGAMALDLGMLALGIFAVTEARPRKIRASLQTRRGTTTSKGSYFTQQDPRSRRARLSLLAASTVVLTICVFAIIHFRIELARVQESPPLQPATLDFYMPEPARGSADAATVRKLQGNYAMLQASHERHLGATLTVLATTAVVCGFIMLFQVLWPRKAQPQPQLESSTPAA